MRKLHPLSISIPAFILGALATASLTTTGKAQGKVELRRPTYHIVTDEVAMNRYAAQGYEVKQANATYGNVFYLMQRDR